MFTFYNDDTFRRVWSHFVGCDDFVLSGVAWLSVDDLDGDDAVGVSDRELGGVKLLAALQPFDLKDRKRICYNTLH